MKAVPVLGTILLIGVLIQIWLGMTGAIANQSLRNVHMAIGFTGLILTLLLTIIAWRSSTASNISRIVMTVVLLVVLAEVMMGAQLLAGIRTLVSSHQATAFLLLVLVLIQGAVTMIGSRKTHAR